MNKLSFIIPFVAGKERPRSSYKGMHYTPQKTRINENSIAVIARHAMQKQKFKLIDKCQPVKINITIYNKSLFGKQDYDNVAKIVGDSLNKIVYYDDRQIVYGKAIKKRNSLRQFIHVEIIRLEMTNADIIIESQISDSIGNMRYVKEIYSIYSNVIMLICDEYELIELDKSFDINTKPVYTYDYLIDKLKNSNYNSPKELLRNKDIFNLFLRNFIDTLKRNNIPEDYLISLKFPIEYF